MSLFEFAFMFAVLYYIINCYFGGNYIAIKAFCSFDPCYYDRAKQWNNNGFPSLDPPKEIAHRFNKKRDGKNTIFSLKLRYCVYSYIISAILLSTTCHIVSSYGWKTMLVGTFLTLVFVGIAYFIYQVYKLSKNI